LSRRELDFVGRHLDDAKPGTALDVGIGNGRILDSLLSRTVDTVFYGVDFAQAMVDVCRSHFADEARVVELALCDIARAPLPFEARFDFISAIRVLKYSPDWDDVLASLVERLEPGGTLVFSMPNRISINRFSRPYSVPWYMTAPKELRGRCETLGASILEMCAFPRFPYIAYQRARGWGVRSLESAERVLSAACGDTFLGRELFVALRKA
jgi:SAM-dependent methyltransferase